MIIDPQATEPVSIYKLMIGSIVPRPIAFVSTRGVDGVNNLAPFSFFTGVSANPPVIGFSPMINLESRRRDSRVNAEARGEFCVNVVSERIAAQMNQTAVDVPPEVDEFTLANLTPCACDLIDAPRVAEAMIAMECRLLQVVDISDKVLGGAFVMGEVVRFHVDDALIDNFRIDADLLDAVGRMAGNSYTRTRDRFDLERPTLPGKP
ncbi:MAG: flavin reductase family protein, partial [Gammaproteobacteria bacterium]